MNISQELRSQIISQMQGAITLNISFIGISNNLFSVLNEMERLHLKSWRERQVLIADISPAGVMLLFRSAFLTRLMGNSVSRILAVPS